MADSEVAAALSVSSTLSIPSGQTLGVRITPLNSIQRLPGRVCGLSASEASLDAETDLISQYMCLDPNERTSPFYCPSQEDLIALEKVLRETALKTDGQILVGLNAQAAYEVGSGQLFPFGGPPATPTAPTAVDFLSILAKAGTYQLASFPIARFNGVALPPGTSIRFADPTRWFGGEMETRLFTVQNANKFYSWDAHAPVGKTPHSFYHVNQKGMYSLCGQSDHAALTGAQLVQARQLRYLKIGGRVFLVVGIVVDTVQLAAAAVVSVDQKSAKPIVAQAIRTASGWAAAWAGAKAGVALGGAAGIETGPGVVLTAIGGGLIGGVVGYFGGDWIADLVYEN